MLEVLHGLIQNREHEVVEFKLASNDFDNDKIGRYFSAISNEANLKGLQYGWLIFGVDNKTRKIVNTNYREKHGLRTLIHEIAHSTTDGITFIDIFEVYDDDKRVVMFKIPASVISVPTAWKGHWYGRDGESLVALSTEELERLRGQARYDWSRQIIENSGIHNLDADAIRTARDNYKEKYNREHIHKEVDNMSDEEFLSKLKLIVDGKLTNAAMVLLGNPDHDDIIGTPVRIMWRLYNSGEIVKDYEEFKIPYISVVDKVYDKVRNLTYRYIPNRRSLKTFDIPKYDINLQRELLNNSIAHMDYTQGGRIYVDEYEDSIIVQNPGTFLPGNVLNVLQPWYTAPYYKNLLLAETMASFNMIDTVAMGIRRVFKIQQERLFPMPDYFFMKPDKVVVQLFGKTIDENYMRVLFDFPEFDLETVYLLDRVQKREPLNKEQYKKLRNLKVIEGKAPNIYVSAMIADITNERTQYTKNKAMDDDFYKELIIKYLQQWGKGKRNDFIKLLKEKLPDTLSDEQKVNKVRNLLMSMSKKEIIERTEGNHLTGSWVLTKHNKK